MTQIEKNKEELRKMIEQLGSAPLTLKSISSLATLHGAYKALRGLCRHQEHLAEHSEIMGAAMQMPAAKAAEK